MTEAELKFRELFCSEFANHIKNGVNLVLNKDECGRAVELIGLSETLKTEKVKTLMYKLEQEERRLLTEVIELDSLQANLIHALHKSKVYQLENGGVQ